MKARHEHLNASTLPPAVESEERQMKRALLAGTLLWFLHLNLVYAIASLSCKWGWFAGKVAGLSTLVLFETIVTLLALLLMAYMVYLPWQRWRAYQAQRPSGNPRLLEDTEKGNHPLVAFIVMALNSFYLLFILASFVPFFALLPCGPL
jgi:hypothetical protein